MAFAGLSMIALVFITALVAYVVYLASERRGVVTESGGSSAAVFEDDELF